MALFAQGQIWQSGQRAVPLYIRNSFVIRTNKNTPRHAGYFIGKHEPKENTREQSGILSHFHYRQNGPLIEGNLKIALHKDSTTPKKIIINHKGTTMVKDRKDSHGLQTMN